MLAFAPGGLPLLVPGCRGGDSAEALHSLEVTMPVQLINPEKLFKPEVYRQVAIGTGARQVHVAGQVSIKRALSHQAAATHGELRVDFSPTFS